MRITIAAVGRIRGRPEAELYRQYRSRLPWPVTVREVAESGRLPPPELKRREGEKLRQALPDGARTMALDAGGKELSSEDFAGLLGQWQDGGVQDVGFVIGGAHGLDETVLAAADRRLSLGRMTWPHLMVRAMLAEQLFRAASILAGHPYHKA